MFTSMTVYLKQKLHACAKAFMAEGKVATDPVGMIAITFVSLKELMDYFEGKLHACAKAFMAEGKVATDPVAIDADCGTTTTLSFFPSDKSRLSPA
nr:hypothetical protein [Tanacetum cinerariifolium]